MLSQRQTNVFLFFNTGWLIHLLISFSLMSDGMCQSVFLSCPQAFSNGLNEVFCGVYNSTLLQPPVCSPAPTLVVFRSDNGSGPKELCRTPYPGSCSQPPTGKSNCSCVKSDAGIYTYQLNVIADKAINGTVNITCAINCAPSPFYGRNDTCVPINYKNTSSTTFLSHTADYTSGSTVPSNVTEKSDTGQKTYIYVIVGVIVGVGGGGIVCGIVVFIIYKKKKKKESTRNDKEQTRVTQDPAVQ